MRARREEFGISAARFARALGVSTATLEEYETGAQRMEAATLFCVSAHLDVSASYFLRGL